METAYLVGIDDAGKDTVVAKVTLTKSLYCIGQLTYFTIVINGGKMIPVVYAGEKQDSKMLRKIIPIKADIVPKLRSFAYIEEIYNFVLLEKIIGDNN